MRKTTRGRLAAFLGALALCIVAAVSTNTGMSARPFGGEWGCDEGCSNSCVSSADAFYASCVGSGGSPSVCDAAKKSQFCDCTRRRECGASCQAFGIESCPGND